jgi:mRNA interferase YafQ
MKYTVYNSSRFKKSLKRVKQLPGFKVERLKTAIRMLSNGDSLPTDFRDHKLTGTLKRHRECHLAPDILLIYQLDEGILILTLVSIGTHSQLFR